MADKKDTPKETPAAAAPAPAPAPAEAEGITPPRKRGRPPKNAPANGDPSPVDGAAADAPRRGRPSGKKKGKVQFTGEDLNTLAKQVFGLHQIAALATGIPELAIREEEATMLGGAIATVAQEYDLEMSGKTGAMLQLIAVCGMVYIPKFAALKTRVAQAKAQREQQGALHVVGGTEHTADT